MTEYPSGVRMDTVLPWVGTVPANVTEPPDGARTSSPSSAAMSTPRCCPAAYGSEPSAKGRSTSPRAGQAQASPALGTASAEMSTTTNAIKRLMSISVARMDNSLDTVETGSAVVNQGYREPR